MTGIRWSREVIPQKTRGAIWIMVGRIKRAGRPRKLNVVRDAKGKSRGEIVDFSTVLNQPHRRHIPKAHQKSELLGYPLGRLRFEGKISEDQLRAGNEWAQLVRSYAASQGIPIGSPRSGSLLSDSGKAAYAFSSVGSGDVPDSEQKLSLSLKTRYSDCYETMMDLGRSLGSGRAIVITVRDVCVQERYPHDRELGDLRSGLNALARVFHIS